jgi:molecular chaperone GrpE
LATLLEKNGVEQIEADGAAFDPNLHNAVMRVEDSGAPADTVVEVLQPGYKIGGRVLRPALVKVSG